MNFRALVFLSTVGVLLLSLGLTAPAAEKETKDFVCGTVHPDSVLKQFQEAIQRGEIPDKSLLPAPRVGKLTPLDHDSITPKTPVTPADLFLYEDTNHRLVNAFNTSIVLNLMVEAANALIARDGDLWDIIAFYCAFTPNEASQANVLAFYIGVKNDASGLGLNFFDNHGAFGLAGTKIQGLEMHYDIAGWDNNISELGDLTEMVIAHEFQHHFSVFWAPTDNGLDLQQGNDTACGPGGAHWNFRVDNQGSCIDAQEWVGSSPANRDLSLCLNGGYNCFNGDIGGTYSYTDLYAMGYVTPAEMDAGNSELRYMNDNCSSPYNSTITSFTSDNIIASNGDRIPDAANSQHSFRTAWIVFYQPGDPPSAGELQRAAGILTRFSQDYHFSTLGRGIMDNSILPPFVMSTSPAAMAASVNSFDPETDRFLPSLDTVGFNIQVIDSIGAYDPNSGLLHYSVEGGAFQTTPLTSLGGGTYHAVVPPSPCEKTVNYYLSFMNSDSSYTINEPLASSTTPFSAITVRSDSSIISDDFETDIGWTVGFTGDAATTGIWTRVDPIGTGAQPEDDNDTGSGTMCYVTGQGPPYGDTADYLGKNDVDGGKTSLISPAFDLAGKNGVVRYARWYSNNAGAAPNTDKMTVTISNDNGVTFPETLEVVTENQIGWVTKQFVVNHYITPTSQMKVRFEASDLGAGSLVEAGVDDFEAFAIDISYTPADVNGVPPVSLPDVIHLVNFVFDKDRPATSCLGSAPGNCWTPNPLCRGDVNGSGGNPNLQDVIYLVNYVFDKDRLATSCLGSSPGNCWTVVRTGECCL